MIDSLRGVAACAVMLYHLYNAVSPHRELVVPEAVHGLFMLGEGGVQIFFVLSGFVIAANLEGLRRLTPTVIGRFMLRRSVRLDPVYWALVALNAVFLMTLSSTAKGESLSVGIVVTNMLYVNGILDQFFIVPVGWTLAFEIQLYLLLALTVGLARPLAGRVGDVAARVLIFIPLLAVSVWAGAETHPVRESAWALGAWHLFFLGVTAWWFTSGRAGAKGFLAASLGGTLAVFVFTREPVTLLAPATALFIAVAAKRDVLRQPLGGPPLQWLGKLSYSLYLVHPLVGNKLARFVVARIPADGGFLEAQVVRWATLFIGIALSVACAWLLWRVIERPAQRLARRVSLAQ